MTDDGDTRGANEPEHSRKWRCKQAKGNGDDGETGVELRGSGAPAADLEIVALKLADAVHADDDEADDKKQQQVSQQAVDAEHGEHSSVVAGEVSEVVVDATLGLAEVGGLGDALDVEELGDGAQVGEARGDGGRAQAVEAAAEVHPRRQGVDGDAEARHDGRKGGVWVVRLVVVVVLLMLVGSNECLLLRFEVCG